MADIGQERRLRAANSLRSLHGIDQLAFALLQGRDVGLHADQPAGRGAPFGELHPPVTRHIPDDGFARIAEPRQAILDECLLVHPRWHLAGLPAIHRGAKYLLVLDPRPMQVGYLGIELQITAIGDDEAFLVIVDHHAFGAVFDRFRQQLRGLTFTTYGVETRLFRTPLVGDVDV